VSAAVAIALGLAGGLGAVARMTLDRAVTARAGHRFPWGILVVNVSGAFVLGVLAGAGIGEDASWILATGFVGAYTTFSTWMVDSRALAAGPRAANLLGSLALGLAAVWLGRELGALL
jgi:fluoride exporter